MKENGTACQANEIEALENEARIHNEMLLSMNSEEYIRFVKEQCDRIMAENKTVGSEQLIASFKRSMQPAC